MSGEKISLIPLAKPAPKESRERAVPKYRASFKSMFFEPSMSQDTGVLMMFTVMPRDFIIKV